MLAALNSQFYLTQRNGQSDWSRNYTVEEKVPVAYAKFNIETMLGNVPLRGNVGMQFVRTDQSSTALQTNGDTLVGRISDGAKYNNVLPSLNLVAQLSDKQYLRFGLAKTMARGRIDDEKVATSAGVALVQQGPGAGQVLWSGSGGNPKLKPYVAVGADLSWELYFGRSSYVAAAVFNKNLLDYIYNQTHSTTTSLTTPMTTPRSRRPAASARSPGPRTAPAARCRVSNCPARWKAAWSHMRWMGSACRPISR